MAGLPFIIPERMAGGLWRPPVPPQQYLMPLKCIIADQRVSLVCEGLLSASSGEGTRHLRYRLAAAAGTTAGWCPFTGVSQCEGPAWVVPP